VPAQEPDACAEGGVIVPCVAEQIVIPTVAVLTFPYTGLAKTLNIATNPAYSISGNTQTAAGSYTATVTLNNAVNYEWANGTTTPITFPWSITKATVTKPTVAVSSFVSDNSPKTLNIATNPAYSISGNTQTAAGSYTATVALIDPVNYEWADGTTANLSFAWTIAAAPISNNNNGANDNSWRATGCAATLSCGGTTPAISQVKITNSNAIQTAGISLAVKSDAVVGIYGLNGSLIQSQSYASGEYSIPLGSLPKGMYIVKVSFDNHSSSKVLRVTVK